MEHEGVRASKHLSFPLYSWLAGTTTERGWTLALLCPLVEMSTDLMGPEWANIVATPEVRVEKKSAARHQESLPS